VSLDALASLDDLEGNGGAEAGRIESRRLVASLGVVSLPQAPFPETTARVAAAVG
jgi:hypothetical protein